MYYIECCGIPGCGKSTTINKVCDTLRKDGYRVITLNDVMRYKVSILDYKMTQVLKAIISPRHFAFNKNVFKCVKKYECNRPSIRFAVRLIKLNYQVQRIKKRENVDVMLLDEGYIQYLTSIPFGKRMEMSDTEREYMYQFQQLSEKMMIVKFEIDHSIVKERLQKRKMRGSRYDYASASELDEMLMVKEKNIFMLCQMLKGIECINIDGGTDNSERLLSLIRQRISER